jgi:hypothetical protein
MTRDKTLTGTTARAANGLESGSVMDLVKISLSVRWCRLKHFNACILNAVENRPLIFGPGVILGDVA